MTKILHVDASSRGSTSISKQLSRYAVDGLLKQEPNAQVKTIVLSEQAPHFLSEAEIGTMFTPAEARTAEQAKIFADIESFSRDWVESDILVFGVPMYNFSVPAAFKAYIDLCIVAGVAFKFGPAGLEPLIKGKKVFVLSSSGSDFSKPPFKDYDFVEPYLRSIFGFVGMTDVSFVRVSGHGESEIATAVEHGKSQIDALLGAQKPATAHS